MDSSLGNRLRTLKGPILITGHTGFKGTWLTLFLERLEIPLVGLSLAPEPESLFERANRTGRISESFADIRDFDMVDRFLKLHRPSAIIHLAAQPLVLESYKTPRETFETNVMGTANIFDAAFKSNSVEAIVVVTTDKVYRNNNSGRPFIESDPLAGKDPYSASKAGTEAAVAAWQQIAKVASGPNIIAARAGNVIGGGDWAANRLIPDLIRGFASDSKVNVRSPESTRPWQHVLDPLQGYIMALEALLKGESIPAVNFGPDARSLSVRNVVEICRKCWPAKTEVEFAQDQTSDKLEAASLQLDSNFARETLGWKSQWSQEESITSTMVWWDKVLNQSINPADACQSDIEILLT